MKALVKMVVEKLALRGKAVRGSCENEYESDGKVVFQFRDRQTTVDIELSVERARDLARQLDDAIASASAPLVCSIGVDSDGCIELAGKPLKASKLFDVQHMLLARGLPPSATHAIAYITAGIDPEFAAYQCEHRSHCYPPYRRFMRAIRRLPS